MAHCRTQIRDTVKDVISGLTQFDSIYNLNVGVYREERSLNIVTLDETVLNENGDMSGVSEQERELRLLLEIRSMVDNEFIDDLDSLADYVENAFFNDSRISDLAYKIDLESLSFEYSREADRQWGKAIMIFSLVYQCDGNDPSVII